MKEREKLERLKEILISYESVLIAFSGGVDSSFLLKVARDTLGKEKAKAATARSETYPEREYFESCQLAKLLDVEQIVVNTSELEIPGYRENSPERCYYCKSELFDTLLKLAKREGLKRVCDGTNLDDISDFRPGRKAAREKNIKSPLVEASFHKEDIRYFSKLLGLLTWDKPSLACLASRFPYGSEITPEKLIQVEQGEENLRQLGLVTLRLRHYGELVRLEVGEGEINKFADSNFRKKVMNYLKKLGFKYITLDLEGYRTGSMNEVLNPQLKTKIAT